MAGTGPPWRGSGLERPLRPAPFPSAIGGERNGGEGVEPPAYCGVCLPSPHLSRHPLMGVEGGLMGEERGPETGERAGGSQLSPGPDRPHPPA